MHLLQFLTNTLQSLGIRSTSHAAVMPASRDEPNSRVTRSDTLQQARLENASEDGGQAPQPRSKSECGISTSCCADENAGTYRDLSHDILEASRDRVSVGSTSDDWKSAKVVCNEHDDDNGGGGGGGGVQVLESPPTFSTLPSDESTSGPLSVGATADAMLCEVREHMALLQGEVECNGARALDVLEGIRLEFSRRLGGLNGLCSGAVDPRAATEAGGGQGCVSDDVTQREEAQQKETAQLERVRANKLMEQIESLQRQTVLLMLENEELRREAEGMCKELKRKDSIITG